MIDKQTAAWLQELRSRARECSAEYVTPEIVTAFYAVGKIGDTYKLSNGKVWWDDPVLVQELHEYADGTVFTGFYVEGVQTFRKQEIQASGLQPVRPSGLTAIFPVTRIAYTDHRSRDSRGRLRKEVYDLRESGGMK